MMKGKKGYSQLWWILGVAILVIVVIVVYLLFFNQGIDKGKGVIDDQFDGLGDSDGDGVRNSFDKCPQTPGEAEFDGCTAGQGGEATG